MKVKYHNGHLYLGQFVWQNFPEPEIAVMLHGKGLSKSKSDKLFKKITILKSESDRLVILYEFIQKNWLRVQVPAKKKTPTVTSPVEVGAS